VIPGLPPLSVLHRRPDAAPDRAGLRLAPPRAPLLLRRPGRLPAARRAQDAGTSPTSAPIPTTASRRWSGC
jgi:hypothetical protein